MKKKLRKKLKKIGEVILAIIVAVPICVGMIICAFGIFIAIGIVASIIIVTVVPIAIIINTVTDLINHKNMIITQPEEEDVDYEEDALGTEEDL